MENDYQRLIIYNDTNSYYKQGLFIRWKIKNNCSLI